MTVKRKAYAIEASDLGPRTVRILASTELEDRSGEVVEQAGIEVDEFVLNPIILWSHNPELPVGTASTVTVAREGLGAQIEFAPEGMSHKADEICRMVKGGIIKTVSIGFDPIEMEPMDERRPRGPQRYKRVKLLEISFVSIPANPEATVVERAHKAKKEADWKVGAAKNLPIEDSDEWDGPAAEASIFEHAGGDEFKPAEVRKGFLVYDAANPTDRGSYKLPIAHVVDGELKVPKGAIKAAASRLPQTDIPDDVKTSAGKVLDHYKEKAGMSEDKKADKKGRAARRAKGALQVKGLYDCARLAYLLDQLGYAQECAEIEAALEGDASKLPAMLAEVMQSLGTALVAMTAEEVAELLADHGEEEDETAGLDEEAVEIVVTAKTPAQRKFRSGYQRIKAAAGHIKAGRKISAATAEELTKAMDLHETAMEHHRKAMRMHAQGMECIKALTEDSDNHQVQTSEGDEENGGAKDLDLRQRRARALGLRPAA